MSKNEGFEKLLSHDRMTSYVPLRQDFVKICGGNITQALILGVLEKKTNERATRIVQQMKKKFAGAKIDPRQIDEENMFVRIPVVVWENESFGALSKFLIAKEMPGLIKAGLVETKRYLQKRDKATFYLLKLEAVEKAINEVANSALSTIFDQNEDDGKDFTYAQANIRPTSDCNAIGKNVTNDGPVFNHTIVTILTNNGQKVEDVIYRSLDLNRPTNTVTAQAHPADSPAAPQRSSPAAHPLGCIIINSENSTGDLLNEISSLLAQSGYAFYILQKTTDPLSSSDLRINNDTHIQDLPIKRPEASRDNVLLCDSGAPDGDTCDPKKEYGFRVDAPEELAEAVSHDGAESESVKLGIVIKDAPPLRAALGFLPDDPDIVDPSIKNQKGKRKRPEEQKKKRRPAFRATDKSYATAEEWISAIRVAFEFGEYPKEVTSEVISAAEHWIRGLYRASPEIAANMVKLDGWPQVIAKVMCDYNKTVSDIMAISDYIRSTAGANESQFDWSSRVRSPITLNDSTRQGDKYVNYLLALSRQPKKKPHVSNGWKTGGQPETPYFGGVDIGIGEQLSKWRMRVNSCFQAGLLWAYKIEGAHKSGDFSVLKDMPEGMQAFIDEYRKIVNWQGNREN